MTVAFRAHRFGASGSWLRIQTFSHLVLSRQSSLILHLQLVTTTVHTVAAIPSQC